MGEGPVDVFGEADLWWVFFLLGGYCALLAWLGRVWYARAGMASICVGRLPEPMMF